QLRQPPPVGRFRLLHHRAGGRHVDAAPPRARAILGLRLPVVRDPACGAHPLVASRTAVGGRDPLPAAAGAAAVPSIGGSAEGDGAAAPRASCVLNGSRAPDRRSRAGGPLTPATRE